MVSVFKQKTAYEMRISDWSSDVCSSDLLDLESLIWLEAFLKSYDGALLMTSHDREFMNRIVGKIVEIDGGALTTYSGNYDFYDQQRPLNEKHLQAQFERQQAMLAKDTKVTQPYKARASHAPPGHTRDP